MDTFSIETRQGNRVTGEARGERRRRPWERQKKNTQKKEAGGREED